MSIVEGCHGDMQGQHLSSFPIVVFVFWINPCSECWMVTQIYDNFSGFWCFWNCKNYFNIVPGGLNAPLQAFIRTRSGNASPILLFLLDQSGNYVSILPSGQMTRGC